MLQSFSSQDKTLIISDDLQSRLDTYKKLFTIKVSFNCVVTTYMLTSDNNESDTPLGIALRNRRMHCTSIRTPKAPKCRRLDRR